jgi:predicted DNA-binding transcriptional regulator AlpA
MYGGIVMAGMPVQLRADEVRGSMIEVNGEQWLDTTEVLDTLKISRSTLYAMRKRGEVTGTGPNNIKLGRCLYFSQRSLLAWMHEQEECL